MGAHDQPAVRARAEDDRLRPHLGARRGRVPLGRGRQPLPRPARRVRDVQRRPQQPARARGARRGARARSARARCSSASRRCRRCSPRSCCARTPARLERVLFTSTGTEAVEAALKLGRAATGRARVVSTEHGFHGLTLGSLSANGNPEFTARFGPLLPGFARVPFGDLERARGRAAPRGRRGLPRRAGAGEGRAPAARRLPRGGAGAVPPLRHAVLRRRGADRLRAHRAACSRSSTGASSPTSCRSRSRSRAATCRSARC